MQITEKKGTVKRIYSGLTNNLGGVVQFQSSKDLPSSWSRWTDQVLAYGQRRSSEYNRCQRWTAGFFEIAVRQRRQPSSCFHEGWFYDSNELNRF
ncbi:hypothetical protein AXX17_AT3G40090 [Arabidopsis thaliana]|uniref:Uncharacterized protein n=1 Tax=Arabidopsis thaliana TaxID=3702 RepID=A0A178V6J2_ARATH|nr:hypothetical protein AXX17_AT3G40090 [Arabidopsis thaliana]